MKIQITSIREMRDEDFWEWANAMIKGTSVTKQDMEKLWLEGECKRVDIYPTTRTTATYRIIERGSQKQ